MAVARPQAHCPRCNKPLKARKRNMGPRFVGDTFIGWMECDCGKEYDKWDKAHPTEVSIDSQERLKKALNPDPAAPLPEEEVKGGDAGKKRTILRELLFDFIENNREYNYEERQAIGTALQCLQPMCRRFEEYNAAGKNAGKRIDQFVPPLWGRDVLEMDMYQQPIDAPPPNNPEEEPPADVMEWIEKEAMNIAGVKDRYILLANTEEANANLLIYTACQIMGKAMWQKL